MAMDFYHKPKDSEQYILIQLFSSLTHQNKYPI